MGYPRRCPICGAYLDPEEICDCKEKAAPVLATPRAAREKSTSNSLPFGSLLVNRETRKGGRYYERFS